MRVSVPILLVFSLAGISRAITIHDGALGAAVNEASCTVARPMRVFDAAERQAFVRFQARQIRAGDQLRVDWIGPSGSIASSAWYRDLPAAGSLCFLTPLSIAGFDPASQPGEWAVRVVVNDTVAMALTFRIAGEPDSGGLRVTAVARRAAAAGQAELVVDGSGFVTDSTVNIAQYKEGGGWTYIDVLLPASVSDRQITVRRADLEPAEYVIIVRNPDGHQSRPARLLIASPRGYRLPTAAGQPWTITQGPYGAFSHWGHTLHAYDIAPQGGSRSACVVAMRGGTVRTFDLGLGQTPHRRIFGNYITVQHEDGEFSHYAHLATGSFLVHNGQRVEQGDPLARVGNSGYTLGSGGGYHVHVQVTKAFPISAPSIPFEFTDLAQRWRGPVVSATGGRPQSCDKPAGGGGSLASSSVGVDEWWSDLTKVPVGARTLDVQLTWNGADRDLDLHLVSPTGRHYGWYGDTTGYSGRSATPERFQVPNPEPGQWRISVFGVKGGVDRTEFHVSTSVAGGAVGGAGAAAPRRTR